MLPTQPTCSRHFSWLLVMYLPPYCLQQSQEPHEIFPAFTFKNVRDRQQPPPHVISSNLHRVHPHAAQTNHNTYLFPPAHNDCCTPSSDLCHGGGAGLEGKEIWQVLGPLQTRNASEFHHKALGPPLDLMEPCGAAGQPITLQLLNHRTREGLAL